MPTPHVICHMESSVDGRIKLKQWSEAPDRALAEKHYERIHEELGGDAWVVGRVTMSGYTRGEPPPPYGGAPLPREPFVADPKASRFAVGLDPHARLHWGPRNEITGDHVVMVLTEAVDDSHLDALRRSGVSYVFGGGETLDVARAVAALAETFGIKRLIVEGGGRTNGAFLRAGMLDELSLLLNPSADGTVGTPAVFDAEGDIERSAKPKLRLTSHRLLDGDVMWLRYAVENAV